MKKEELLKLIKDKYPQYADVNDEELYNLVVSKFPQYKELKLSDKLTKSFSSIAIDTFKKVSVLFIELKNFLKSENSETRDAIKEATNELIEIKKKVPTKVLDDILAKLSTLSPKDYEKTLTELTTLLKVVSEKESIPENLIKDGRVKIELSDEQLKELKKSGGKSGYLPTVVDQETKNILYAIRDNTAGFDIPAYDTREIDEDNAPTTVIITYKKNGATVATQTISKVGNKTTITVV